MAPRAPADRSAREDGDVERRVVGPRPEHAVIEVEPVHLRADDVPVHLLRDRPARRDRWRPGGAGSRQLALLRGHRRRGVVGHAVHQLRLLERAPVREERHEIRVPGAHARGGAGERAVGEKRGGRKQAGDDEGGRARGSLHQERDLAARLPCPLPPLGGRGNRRHSTAFGHRRGLAAPYRLPAPVAEPILWRQAP